MAQGGKVVARWRRGWSWSLVVIVLLGFGGACFAPRTAGAAVPGGAVLAWGGDNGGQLGDGTVASPPSVPSPQVVPGLTDVVGVAAGESFSVAVGADGAVWTWGNDSNGQLGDGTIGNPDAAPIPQQVPGLTGVQAVSAGQAHALALKRDGTVWAWGWDLFGQLGDGRVGLGNDRPTPQPVPGLTGMTAVSAGYKYSLALKGDGTVWAWGIDSEGVLGDGTIAAPPENPSPRQVVGLSGVVAISATSESFRAHSLALKGDGTVWAWGSDAAGQLGDGTVGSPTATATPQPVPGLAGVSAIGAGHGFSLAVKGDGTLWAWGSDTNGTLGDGTVGSPDNVPTPRAVPGLSGIVAAAAGRATALAVKGDGTLWAWGSDRLGQLGDGTAGSPDVAPTPRPVPGLTGIVAANADFSHVLAIRAANAPAFADVPTGYWAAAQIAQFASRGITTGCGANDAGQPIFCPERGVTRAEMAVFLTRTLGQDQLTPPATPTFVDVPTGYWAYGQIEAFLKLGITTGCGEDAQGRRLFCPERGVTRAEMAAFMVRAKGQTPLAPSTPTFADVPAEYWAYGQIERFLALGVTTGCGEDDQGRKLFCPERGVTRAEMAVFIIRAYPLQYQ